MPSKQKRAQGGGRTPNSEPKLQVFKEFSGINFEHENHLFGGFQADYGRLDPGDQTDLQMNYVFLQNNVATASNKTFETRDNIVTLFDAPEGVSFTGPVCLIGSVLYAARSDNKIGYASITDSLNPPEVMTSTVKLNSWGGNHDDDDNYIGSHVWTNLSYYDDKLIGMTKKIDGHGDISQSSGGMWIGDVESFSVPDGMYRPQPIQDPTDDLWSHLAAKGTLTISQTMTQQCPFRIMLAFDYVNIFGPTKLSPNTVFYASAPVSEWHAGCYLSIENVMVFNYPGIKAVEIFYATDNAMDLLFLDRVEFIEQDPPPEGYSWSYDWYGYIDATSMWAVSNLTTPTENYTAGLNTTRMCTIDSRLYFWGDEEQPQRLYIGGNPGNLFSISPGTGGGFVDVEPGTSKCVRYVCKYKTQSGNSIVTMLCDSPNTRQEQRFNLVENTVSISNEQSMKSWQAEQVAGAIGCKSYDGAVVCEDGLYSVSRYGLALTTMTMEYNSQIRTNYVSDPIKTVFTDVINRETRLSKSMILELDGVIYIALGGSRADYMDNVIFCYDIDLKSWWTYTLDVEEEILKIFHVDYEDYREGIGIVTSSHIYLLPTTDSDWEMTPSNHDFLIETAELSTQVPQQGWQYLSQLEFHFDYFIGEMTIHMHAFDMFGRKLDIVKNVHETSEQFNYVVHMRIDQRLMSYVIIMDGSARFRMTHFIARVYTLSNKIGQVWGFDDSISIRQSGDEQSGRYNNRIHPTFKCYNDIRKAIFT